MFATPGRIFAATSLAILAAALAWAPLARSAVDPVGEGQTRLTLSTGLHEQLRRSEVRLVKLKPGKAQGRTVTLPADSGGVDPVETSALVDHRGGFKLVAGRRVLKVRELSLDTAAGKLSGTIGGRRLAIAALRGLDAERKGFGLAVDVKALMLTANAAAVLNRALGQSGVFRGGRSLGRLVTVVQPETVTIEWARISLGGEPGTVLSKLESLGVEMGLWGRSERWGESGAYFLFDALPTTVTPDASTGVVESEPDSGVTMQMVSASTPREMLLRDPRVDLAGKELVATVSGLALADPLTATIATLDYSAATFEVRPTVRMFNLMGIRAIASQFIADQLNTRFATPGLFNAGETLARMTVTLDAQ